MTWCTSPAVAANTTAAAACSASVPGQAGDRRATTVVRSASAPARDAAAVRPAEAAVAVDRGHRQQPPADGCPAATTPAARRARRPAPPRTGRSPHASRCRGQSQPGVAQRSGRADSVGQVALGRRADAARRSRRDRSTATSPTSRWVAWTAREPLAERTRGVRAARRACTRARRGTPRSPPAARTRGRAARRRARRPRGARRRSPPDRRRERSGRPRRSGAGVRRRRAPSTALGPRLGRAVGEAPLHGRSAATPKPALQVAGVEQGDADAGVVGGVEQRRPISFGVGVWRPAGSWWR